MKTFFSFFLSAALFTSGTIFAQNNKPSMAFEEKEFNFGTFKESDGIVMHDFRFTNTGKIPLIINEVKASCGCTTPDWPREPILPGKAGTIKVSYDPDNRPGSFNKTIQVGSNADIPLITLAIAGVVIPVDRVEETYKFTAGQVRLETIYAAFGEIFKGDTGQFSIRVFNTSNDKPVALSFKQIPGHLKIKISPDVIEPQQEGRIDIKYVSSLQKEWDYAVDRVDLLLNGSSVQNNRISITANIREDFSKISPEDMAMAPQVEFDNKTFDFGTIKGDAVVEHLFRLSNTGKSDLYIRKVGASCGCTAVQPAKTTILPGESTVIKAIFKAAGREGNQKKAITVITNDPKRSKTILWVNGVVEKAGPANQSTQN